jgi:CRISPR system Cascade subunit CasB
MTQERSAEPLIAALERLARVDDRAALSALRRSLSADATAQAYPYVVPFFPRERAPWLESTYLLIAGLFALHPLSGELTLAAALRRVYDATGSTSVEQRFVALLDAHRDDLGAHLRHAVSLVRSNEIAVDWHDILRTIRNWNEDWARRRWARDFWKATAADEGEPS